MTGVEILSSATIYNTILPGYWLGLGLMLGFISFIIAMCCIPSDYLVTCTIFIVLAMCFVAMAICGGTSNQNDIHHIEYKVTIDDSVSMNEFLDKYEILDQEGKIYTVKERE